MSDDIKIYVIEKRLFLPSWLYLPKQSITLTAISTAKAFSYPIIPIILFSILAVSGFPKKNSAFVIMFVVNMSIPVNAIKIDEYIIELIIFFLYSLFRSIRSFTTI